MGRRLSIRPAAKINLHLAVSGRCRDSYHRVQTLMQSIDLRDHLEIEEAPDGVLELRVTPDGAVSSGEDNLVLQAARHLAEAVGCRRGARCYLTKRIPVGAGLGGGSADAAATLVLLDELWECGLDAGTMHGLAARLGADVPFFLHGGLVLGEGRGDELTKLPDPPEDPVLVVVPGVRVATAEAYRRYDRWLTSHRQEGTLDAFAAGLRGRPDWRTMNNELESAVIDAWPAVGEGLRALRESAACFASLSGTGAASFAVFGSRRAALQAAARLPESWFKHVGTTIRRSSARLTTGSDGGSG